MRHLFAPALGVLCFTVLMFGGRAAHAQSLAACGNIHVEANARCDARVEGGCEAHCSDLSFEASCSAEGYIRCRSAECNLSAEVDCTGSCSIEKCQTQCEIEPPKFECEANCVAGCDANCSGRCDAECGSDSGCKSRCQGSCKATCQGECNVGCQGTPGSANCEAKCRASCQGQCRANANAKCQIDCQAKTPRVQCETELRGGCVAECEQLGAVVDCDGEYIDHGGNAEECLDAIENWAASIDASASGSATAGCSNGVCSAEAEGEASCECAAPGGSPIFGTTGAVLGASALAIGAVLRRRRRVREGR